MSIVGGIFAIISIGLLGGAFVCVIIAMIADSVCAGEWIAPVLAILIIIAIIVLCIVFAKSYNIKEYSVQTTVIKAEILTFENSAIYRIWSNDNAGKTWQTDVDSLFYANIKIEDRLVIKYKVINNIFETDTIKITEVVRGG